MTTSAFRNVHSLEGKIAFSVKVTVYLSEYFSEKYTVRDKCKHFGEMGVLLCMPEDISYCQASRCVLSYRAEQQLLCRSINVTNHIRDQT